MSFSKSSAGTRFEVFFESNGFILVGERGREDYPHGQPEISIGVFTFNMSTDSFIQVASVSGVNSIIRTFQ